MKERIKVVWLCHLTNEKLNAHFGVERNMCAYWMTQFIDMMKEHIEIHVVAPNYYNNQDTCFELEGVTYHFYKYYSGIGGTKAALVEIALRREKNIQNRVVKIVERIKPDLLHLFGAENITYSSGVLPFLGKLPTIVSFQGYIQLAEMKGSIFRKLVLKRRVEAEECILSKCSHISFGMFEKSSEKYFVEKYGRAVVHPINFPFKFPEIDASIVNKEFDIVFWGRVTYEKGVEDLINAVGIIKSKIPNVKCLILGGGSQDYLSKLKNIVEKNKLVQNIIFGGFQKTDQLLFKNASKAKVYVLPTHFDALPGSIRESMALKLPVVAYAVGDIPALNNTKENIALVKPLDVEELANTIYSLLSCEELRNKFIENSYNEIIESSSDDAVVNQFLICYNSILS